MNLDPLDQPAPASAPSRQEGFWEREALEKLLFETLREQRLNAAFSAADLCLIQRCPQQKIWRKGMAQAGCSGWLCSHLLRGCLFRLAWLTGTATEARQ